MELIERTEYVELLQKTFNHISSGEGHCVFVSGEAGVGKSAMVKHFCKTKMGDCDVYLGACDALFTPRPLAPLYDILWQLNSDLLPGMQAMKDRSELFFKFFRELSETKQKIILVFEDIHWADEATLDFIKFFARRISLLPCLFILTYRDDEIHSRHPLNTVLGHLQSNSFTSIYLPPLSKAAVDMLAAEKGYSGDDVYKISAGNPFYVTEILASYSEGVPDNIKNAILSSYNRTPERTRRIWDLLSVIPIAFEIAYLEKIEPHYKAAITDCVDKRILIVSEGKIYFKHELYRRTVESSLSPLLRIELNKRILEFLKIDFEEGNEIERIIHHAKNANEYNLVVHYAPIAARRSARVGAHIEAAKLFLTAINYYKGHDKDVLIDFYEGYAYECYLTNCIKEAIAYAVKSLEVRKQKNQTEKIGNSLRFLSRLWWFEGNRKNAEHFAEQAIEVLKDQPSSSAKAMAFSNMAQLKMLSDQSDECISWGEKAIAIAEELKDEETLSHALNNVGCVRMQKVEMFSEGLALLHRSLELAQKNSFHDHVARAYCNIATISANMKYYTIANQTLDVAVLYCEERDLDGYTSYMLAWKARVNFETGCWTKARQQAEDILNVPDQTNAARIVAIPVLAKIKLRTGDGDPLPSLLEAKSRAFETMELQRIAPVVAGLLEYEWITGIPVVDTGDIDMIISMMAKADIFNSTEFAFWLRKTRNELLPAVPDAAAVSAPNQSRCSPEFWSNCGCTYEYALCLFEGDEDDKRKAVLAMHELGATVVVEKMKLEMRASGIKNIPRGISRKTRSNPAFLTDRELAVLQLLQEGLQNKEIAGRLFIAAKTVDHHISSIFFKLDVNSRSKAVAEAMRRSIIR
ncbi:MAG: AAA family ATPase [Chitinophagaceae bacterium]|nr:AAA family ATPase [Chitinophagaceae bacterium]